MAVTGALGTISRTSRAPGVKVLKVAIPWTSDASAGSVTEIAVTGLSGRITRVVTDPGATAPTDDYDLTILDEHGIDLLGGQGANRDTATTESLTVTAPLSFNGSIYPTIANAGNSKVGTITLYIERI